ncbi:MAG TPA: tetratricopeptide repeat protein [Clostridia bacterium]|nr:tetratricopeptide repeat protein [Clostridia bacterium]
MAVRRIAILFFSMLMHVLALPAHAQQWIEVRSPNFVIATDGSDRQAREILNRFEQMRGVFASMFRRTKVNSPVPLSIVAFRSSKDLRAAGPVYNGKAVEVAGFYQQGEDRNYIALDLSSENNSVAFHEYAHTLLNSNYPRTQAWFDEGFAEYYASMKVSAKDVEIGQAPPSASVLNQANSLTPMVDLFSVAHESNAYNESGHARQLFYAQSWLVVHWIFDNQKMNELGQYFDLSMNRKVPIADAIRQAFGMDAKQFDKVIYEYWRAGRGTMHRVPAPVPLELPSFTVSKLTDAQALAIVADLHAHVADHHAQAVEEFKQVLANDPNNPIAHRGVGLAYLRSGDFDLAAQHLQRAAQLNPNDSRAHYYYAVLLNRGSQTDVRIASKAQQILFELQRAVDLDQQYADAYHLLAWTSLLLDRPEPALAQMRRAVELSPRNEVYLLNLAQMQMFNNKYDDAKGLLQHLQNSQDSKIATQATEVLTSLDTRRTQQTRWSEQHIGADRDPTAPQWRPKENPNAEAINDAEPETKTARPDMRKVEFAKGTLLSIDCSAAPRAVLNMTSGGKHLKMQTADSRTLVLIGAEKFSCEWKNVKVAVNYKSDGPGQGELISLELQ